MTDKAEIDRLINDLWESDAANSLTNRAARALTALQAQLAAAEARAEKAEGDRDALDIAHGQMQQTLDRLTAELEVAREMNGALLEANEELGPALADAIARAKAAEALLGAAYRAALDDAAGVKAHIDGIGPSHMPNRWQDAIRALPVPADLAARLAKEAGE